MLLLDANSLIHRAFHALPPLTTPSGAPSGALYGLASILIKIFRERPPRYAIAAFDHPKPTFREKEYRAYKATRPRVPDELISQIIEAHTLLGKFHVQVVEKAGWEADDIVATLAAKHAAKGLQVVILSGDLDTLQAVKGNAVVVEVPQKGISDTVVYTEDKVEERFGTPPRKLADYKGLVGDVSDNIPGVPGIGPKTAAALLADYNSLEEMYEDIREVGMSNAKLREKLLQHEKQALLSKKLAVLDTNTPVSVSLQEAEVGNPLEDGSVIEYLEILGFGSLARRVVEGNRSRYNRTE